MNVYKVLSRSPNMTELESRYGPYISKTEIAYLNESCTERGVFATEDISENDIILKIPLSECFRGNHIDLTYQLMDMDNEYARSLPTFVTNFPVMWTPSQVESLDGSAMKDMIASRKESLIREDVKKRGQMFLRYRLLVGSRGFSRKEDKNNITMVPYADMLNHSNTPNIDWKITDDHVVLWALQNIKKGEECCHTYGTKTNYEHLLFYGMTLPNNLRHDITYELFTIPTQIRENLNYKYFQDTVEFELCGSYSRGTCEIFSFVRFLVCKNANAADCPQTLRGLYVQPIGRHNETIVAKVLNHAFMDIFNQKVKRLRNAQDKVADFAQTEINILLHWINLLKQAILVLEAKTSKKASKLLFKMEKSLYVDDVLRKIVFDKKSYINA